MTTMEGLELSDISNQDCASNKRMLLGDFDSLEANESVTDPAPETAAEKESDAGAATLKVITRKHWQPASDRTSCYNSSCHKHFTLLVSHHHCRRCGEVFCENCVRYLSRLNNLAQPDPNGEMQKVCKECYDTGKVTDEGQRRGHTNDFSAMRTKRSDKVNSQVSTSEESHQQFEKACERLLKGFEKKVGNSEIKRTLQEMKQGMKKPKWMKASARKREKHAASCQICEKKFDFTRKKRSCYVCGKSVCQSCSTKDLLIYIPDGKTDGGEGKRAQIAVIRIIGCPEKEPNICLYLRCCPFCKEKLTDRQVQAVEKETKPSTSNADDFMNQLDELHEIFQKAENIINQQMAMYKKRVDTRGVRRRRSTRKSVKPMIQLEKDLSQNLGQYMSLFEQLKRLRPVTTAQTSMFEKFKRTKSQFYMENRALFEAVKRRLTDAVPPKQQAACLACVPLSV